MECNYEGSALVGSFGAIVEVDEIYIGKHDDVPHCVKGYWIKDVVLSLVERGGHFRTAAFDEVVTLKRSGVRTGTAEKPKSVN